MDVGIDSIDVQDASVQGRMLRELKNLIVNQNESLILAINSLRDLVVQALTPSLENEIPVETSSTPHVPFERSRPVHSPAPTQGPNKKSKTAADQAEKVAKVMSNKFYRQLITDVLTPKTVIRVSEERDRNNAHCSLK
jgi:hypothetical protein